MFKYKWPGKILFDNKYAVYMLGRGSIIYKENEKKISINSELLAYHKGIAIYKNSIKKWNTPYENELISIDKQSEILENIKAALEFRKIKVEII